MCYCRRLQDGQAEISLAVAQKLGILHVGKNIYTPPQFRGILPLLDDHGNEARFGFLVLMGFACPMECAPNACAFQTVVLCAGGGLGQRDVEDQPGVGGHGTKELSKDMNAFA